MCQIVMSAMENNKSGKQQREVMFEQNMNQVKRCLLNLWGIIFQWEQQCS